MQKNFKYDLIADSLIAKYLIIKIRNGRDPKFSEKEFVDFLHYCNDTVNVEGIDYDVDALFQKLLSDKKEAWTTLNGNFIPHITRNDQGDIVPTYRLRTSDWKFSDSYIYEETFSNLITFYISQLPKRQIEVLPNLSNEELALGERATALLASDTYNLSYVTDKDINKIMSFYITVSERMASLVKENPCLRISNKNGDILAYSNYSLLLENGNHESFPQPRLRNVSIDFCDSSYTSIPKNTRYLESLEPSKQLSLNGQEAKKLVLTLNRKRKDLV